MRVQNSILKIFTQRLILRLHLHTALFVLESYHGLLSTSPDYLDHIKPMTRRLHGIILFSYSTEDGRQH